MIAVIFEVWPAYGRRQEYLDIALRIAGVIRDYGMFERAETPADSRRVHD